MLLSSLTSLLPSESPEHVDSYLMGKTHTQPCWFQGRRKRQVTDFSVLQWEVGEGLQRWLSVSQGFCSHFIDKEIKAQRTLVMYL